MTAPNFKGSSSVHSQRKATAGDQTREEASERFKDTKTTALIDATSFSKEKISPRMFRFRRPVYNDAQSVSDSPRLVYSDHDISQPLLLETMSVAYHWSLFVLTILLSTLQQIVVKVAF